MSEFGFEMDPNKYTKKEMHDLLNLKPGFTMENVVNNESELKEKLLMDESVSEKKRQEITVFLQQIKDTLLEEARTEFATLSNTNVLEGGQHSVIRPSLPNSKKMQNNPTINPLAILYDDDTQRHTLHKLLCIDSQFRDDYYRTQSTDFHLTLPTTIKNVVSMSLSALELPSTYYTISKQVGNNYFWLGWIPPSVGALFKEVKWYFISVPDGQYQRSDMEKAINESIQKAIGLPPELIPQCVIDERTLRTVFAQTAYTLAGLPGSAGSSHNAQIQLLFNRTRGKTNEGEPITATVAANPQPAMPTPPPPYFNLQWGVNGAGPYREPGFHDAAQSGSIVSNMGWTMGFRMAEYLAAEAYVSEGCFDTWGFKYIYLVVDDFNNNAHETVIPAYTDSLGSSNVLARLTTGSWGGGTGEFATGLAISDLVGLQGEEVKKRVYFGPVDIKKLHLRILDDKGQVLQLNNMDVSFALDLVYLYNHGN
jgi:hypothetical protein